MTNQIRPEVAHGCRRNIGSHRCPNCQRRYLSSSSSSSFPTFFSFSLRRIFATDDDSFGVVDLSDAVQFDPFPRPPVFLPAPRKLNRICYRICLTLRRNEPGGNELFPEFNRPLFYSLFLSLLSFLFSFSLFFFVRRDNSIEKPKDL